NDTSNHLHRGQGFHQIFWIVETFDSTHGIGVKLSYYSEDGENRYPGNVKVTITYLLNNNNQLVVDYLASTDKQTPLTLTNHTYFNLSGNLKDSIMEHVVTMN